MDVVRRDAVRHARHKNTSKEFGMCLFLFLDLLCVCCLKILMFIFVSTFAYNKTEAKHATFGANDCESQLRDSAPCPADAQTCNQDCILATFGPWSLCKDGSQIRVQEIAKHPKNDGKECPNESARVEMRECDENATSTVAGQNTALNSEMNSNPAQGQTNASRASGNDSDSNTGDEGGVPSFVFVIIAVVVISLLALCVVLALIRNKKQRNNHNGAALDAYDGDLEDSNEHKYSSAPPARMSQYCAAPVAPGGDYGMLDSVKSGEYGAGPALVDQGSVQEMNTGEYGVAPAFADRGTCEYDVVAPESAYNDLRKSQYDAANSPL